MHLDKNVGDMRKTLFFLIALLLVLTPFTAMAYEPILLPYYPEYRVEDPNKAVGYYSTLRGGKMEFRMNFDNSGQLVVKLMVPKVHETENDRRVTAEIIYKDETEGYKQKILSMPEEGVYYVDELTGNEYYQGPEFKVDVAAGAQAIIVSSSPANEKPFVLIIGESEDSSFGAHLRRMYQMALIKNDVYAEFPIKAFYNVYGVILLVPVLVIVLLVTLIAFKEYKRIKKQDEDEESQEVNESSDGRETGN